MGPSGLVCALLLAACCCCRRAAGEWLRRGPAPPSGPGQGSLAERARGAEPAARRRSGLCAPACAPPSRRLARVQLFFAASLQPRSQSIPGRRTRGGGCCPEPEGVEPSLSGELGESFLPQVPTLGARGWSGGGRRRWSASPNPRFCARLLLEKAACLAGGGAPTPPLRPGLRARLEVSERGRDGGSRPSKGVGRGWGAAWVASRLSR